MKLVGAENHLGDTESALPGNITVLSTHLALDLYSYRSHLHHLQLDVLWLGQAASCLRHRDVLDPLVVPLSCAIVCCKRLRKLRHGLGQQICRLWRQMNQAFTKSSV